MYSQGPSRSHASIHLSMLIIVFVALVSLSVNLPPHAVTKRHKFPRESALFSSITNVLPSSLNLNLIFSFPGKFPKWKMGEKKVSNDSKRASDA